MCSYKCGSNLISRISQEKVAKNKCKLEGVIYLVDMNNDYSSKRESSLGYMISYRRNNPLAILKPQLTYDLDSPDIRGVTIYPTAKLPLVEKIPRYTTWVPSDRYFFFFSFHILLVFLLYVTFIIILYLLIISSIVSEIRLCMVYWYSNKLMAEDQPDEQKHQYNQEEKLMIR